jgi:tRNA-specific 2-thiouridylase
MHKIVLGLSGGVDSAVAARLLQRDGWEVSGLYLDIGAPGGAEDARRAAESLGVPLTVLDIRAALEAHVCAPFAAAYLRGETPNPCVLCNPAVKFAALCREADGRGAEKIATGHYARVRSGALCRGLPANDQSYMLCRLTRAQLARLVLPLGGYEKTQVRALAREFALPMADKPDSMEICFIPENDYTGWLQNRGLTPRDGSFVRDGTVLGPHGGIHRWTVGQRIPGVFDGEKLYVRAIDPATGDIAVCPDPALFRPEFEARDFHWLIDPPDAPLRGSVKVRHTRKNEVPCTAVPRPDGTVRFVCDTPVRAPAPGQSAVLYDGDRLLGGGFLI